MKVALVQPPNVQRAGDWKKMRVAKPPINIALLAAYIRQFGHEPLLYDLDWFDGSLEEMAALILTGNPGVVGITCLTPRIQLTLSLARSIKNLNRQVTIIIGGAHVNAVREESLYTDDIDYAIYGESEKALLKLVEAIDAGHSITDIPNLIYRNGEHVVINPTGPLVENLDELPFPAWDLLDLETYIDPPIFDGAHMGVMTSRGCPWHCIFCASGVTWGSTVRFRSAENVIEELEQIVHKLGIRNIMFYDDTFTMNKKNFLKICNGIVKRNLNLKYYSQVRVDTIDEEVAAALAESGCISAAIGAESGNNEVLKTLKKWFKTEDVIKAVSMLKAADVPILATYIIGCPGENHESIERTLKFSIELGTNQAKYMILTPFPRTELFRMCVEKGLLPSYMTPAQWSKFTYYQHVAANLSKVSTEELLEFQRIAYETFPQRPLIPSRLKEKG